MRAASKSCAQETDAHVCSSTQHTQMLVSYIKTRLVYLWSLINLRCYTEREKTKCVGFQKRIEEIEKFLSPARVCCNNFDNAKSASTRKER